MCESALVALVRCDRRLHNTTFASVNVLHPIKFVDSSIRGFLLSQLPVLSIHHAHFKQRRKSFALRVVREQFSNLDMPRGGMREEYLQKQDKMDKSHATCS